MIDRGEDLALTEGVVMEVLAGARSPEDAEELTSQLRQFELLPLRPLEDYEEAAALFRRCRAGGETIRSMVDCLIAVPVIRAGAELLHADAAFDAIARHTSLRIHPASSA